MKTEMKDRIRARRVQLSVTQLALAKKLGVSRVSVTKWENGTTRPDGENLHQLAVALQTTPEWLLYGQGDEVDDTKVIPYLKPPTPVPIISSRRVDRNLRMLKAIRRDFMDTNHCKCFK